MEQIEKKRYDAELLEARVKEDDLIKIAVAFKGKDVSMKW